MESLENLLRGSIDPQDWQFEPGSDFAVTTTRPGGRVTIRRPTTLMEDQGDG